MRHEISIGGAALGGNGAPLVIAGPCVIESREVVFETAETLKDICSALGLPFVFKCSYDKANRTSAGSPRGPGLKDGLKMLNEVKEGVGVPVISDVHSVDEVGPAAEVLDALQVPAFLCRQTDLIAAAARTGKPVNVKKGQFLAPWDVKNIIDKFVSAGNEDIFITERGVSFGYNNLVVDMRAFPIMRALGRPVVFDVTHSLQLPGAQGGSSGGQREFAAPLARAAVAAGVDGLFIEVHPDPEAALCDGPSMVPLAEVKALLESIKGLSDYMREQGVDG